MKNLKLYEDHANESDYQNPETFEDVDGIDVSLTPMRKAVKIAIGGEAVELSKEDAQKIMGALENATRRM